MQRKTSLASYFSFALGQLFSDAAQVIDKDELLSTSPAFLYSLNEKT